MTDSIARTVPLLLKHLLAMLSLLIASVACGAKSSSGESHFLQNCGVCVEGYDCIGGVCSLACETAPAVCDVLPGRPRCTADGEIGEAICDVSCNTDTDCSSVGNHHACSDGFCRWQPNLHDGASERGCSQSGTTYPYGAVFECSDGCNTCYCTEQGIESTLLECASTTETCTYDGETYMLGDSWLCNDGCGSCTCSANGVQQTPSDCDAPTPGGESCEYDGQSYADGDTWTCRDGCNRCMCSGGNVRRTLVAC